MNEDAGGYSPGVLVPHWGNESMLVVAALELPVFRIAFSNIVVMVLVVYGVDILVGCLGPMVMVRYAVVAIVVFRGILHVRLPLTWLREVVGGFRHQNVPIHLLWVVSALVSWQGTGYLLEHYPSPVMGIG